MPSTARLVSYGVVAILVLVTVVLVPLSGVLEVPRLPVNLGNIEEGRVVELLSDQLQESQRGDVRSQVALVQVGGEQVQVEHVFVEGSAGAFALAPGDEVLVTSTDVGGETRYLIQERVRRTSIWVLSLAFALLVVAVGGRQGALSLVALGISFLVIVRFIVPAIYAGWDPVLAAILGSLVIMSASLIIGHGPSTKTWVALGGTAAALALTGLLAVFTVGFAQLTGLGDEDGATLQALVEGVSARGLLLGGIIIGALGVLDDVTTTQASTVMEIHRANRSLGPAQLFARAMNVGRDHIASTTNTLVLAYAGASLPLLMILAGQGEPLGILISYEQLATEVVRTLVGSMGIVAAVPITTGLAAFVVGSGWISDDDRTGAAMEMAGFEGHRH
ncbi:MAG: YibE/F family protein [Dehalococcoidia bacterium]|nr:YibE/F family protein [Dehalococcoidia bacterium]